MVRCYAPDDKQAGAWHPPEPLRLGEFKAPVESWREHAQEV